jgi:hypothetical protein
MFPKDILDGGVVEASEDKGYLNDFTYSDSLQPQLQVSDDQGCFQPWYVKGILSQRSYVACLMYERQAKWPLLKLQFLK